MLMRLHHVQRHICNWAGQLDKPRAHVMIDESTKKAIKPIEPKESCFNLDSCHFCLVVHNYTIPFLITRGVFFVQKES